MAPGARSKFGAPMFEPEVFRQQMYCIEVLLTLLGLFVVPRSHSAPGELCPLHPHRYAPGVTGRSDAPQQTMVLL